LLALTPTAAGICFVIFLIIWMLKHYVSLGSIVSAFFFPFIQYFLEPDQDDAMLAFSIIIALTVILSHRKNIIRLLEGVETKTYPFRLKQKKNV